MGPLLVGPAPGWAQLHNIVPENTFSRWSDTKYLFNFTATTLIPRAAAKGSVIIDFPN